MNRELTIYVCGLMVALFLSFMLAFWGEPSSAFWWSKIGAL